MKKLFLFVIIPLLFLACEDGDINDFNKAQACLDSSTSASAQACVAPLAGNTSPAAYRLRCAAYFIEQGLDNSGLAQIFSDLQGDTEVTFTNFSKAMVFSSDVSKTDAVNKANAMKENCFASNSSGMIMFASIAHSTTILLATTTWNGTESDINGKFNSFGNGNDTEIGENILSLHNVFCSNGSGQDEICNQINTIITNAPAPGGAKEIGEYFGDYLEP